MLALFRASNLLSCHVEPMTFANDTHKLDEARRKQHPLIISRANVRKHVEITIDF